MTSSWISQGGCLKEILPLVIRKPLLSTSSTVTKTPSYLRKYTATKAVIDATTTDTVIEAICMLLSFRLFVCGVEVPT